MVHQPSYLKLLKFTMSSSNDDQHKEEESPPMPTFSGNVMPVNVTVDIDDDIGEEATRRIGGATFNPTFEPVSFEPANFLSSPAMISTVQTKTAVTTASPMLQSGWKLAEAPILPEFHPLDRNSVFIAHTGAPVIAQRVAEILKERSIEAHFDNSKAKVRCLTSYNVDFRIFLYRGQQNYSHGIIVEVQRRSGCSTLFVEDTQAILDAVQGKISPRPPSLTTNAEIPLVSDDDYDDTDASLSSLDFVARMLNFPGTLGLETLSSLVDPARMGKSTSSKVSTALIQPNNEVGSKIFAIIVDKKSPDEDDEGQRHLAMTILSNILHNTWKQPLDPTMREALLPVLVKKLEAADKNPQMAFLAARCLEALILANAEGTSFSNLYAVLDEAENVGEARHAALRNQAQKCIRLIDASS
jgi:hypothetical protein